MRIPHPARSVLANLPDVLEALHRRESTYLAFELIVRIDVLLLSSVFLESDDWQDPRLRDRLLKLYKNNTLGDWVEWLSWELQTAPAASWIEDLRSWYRRRREDSSALIALRNRAAHGVDRTDPENIGQSSLEAEELFQKIFADHPPLGDFEVSSDAEVVYEAGTSVVDCSPLMIFFSFDLNLLWLYDRSTQDGLRYIARGTKDGRTSDLALQELREKLRRKHSSLESFHDHSPCAVVESRLAILNEQARDRLYAAGKYKPESSVPRRSLDLILQAFLTDKPRLLLLDGPRGSGKSTWACLAVRNREAIGLPVLLLTGAELAHSAFPKSLAEAISLDGDFLTMALRQAERSADGRFVLFIEDADSMALQDLGFISCLRWAASIGDLPLKIVVTMSSNALNRFRESCETWLSGPSIRHAAMPLMDEYEILAMADALAVPPDPNGDLLRAARRELAATLVHTMGPNLRAWLVRSVLERAYIGEFGSVFSVFEMYQELYSTEVLQAQHRGRARILRELAAFLCRTGQHTLSIDQYVPATQPLLSILDSMPEQVKALVDDGILIEGMDSLDRCLSFSDEHFRDFLASISMAVHNSEQLELMCREIERRGNPLTVLAFTLIRRSIENPETYTSLFEGLSDGCSQVALLNEIALYHVQAFLTLFASFYRINRAGALDLTESLLYSEMPRIAILAGSIGVSMSSGSSAWREHLVLALCKFGIDDYDGTREELQYLDLSRSSRAQTLKGDVEVSRGFLEDAEAAYRAALLSDFADYPQGMGHALRGLGYVLYRKGQLAEAQETLEAACTEMARFGDSINFAEALGDLGETLCAEGCLEASKAKLLESLAINQHLGRVGGVGIVEGLLAIVDWKQGNISQAEARFFRALDLVRHACYRWREAWLLQKLGDLQTSQGRTQEASVSILRSRRMFELLKAEPES